MSEPEPLQLPTPKVTLPSGGWATFKDEVKYGARRQLAKLAGNIATRANSSDGQVVTSVDFDPTALANASEAQTYFPLCHLLTGWSFELPLPTIANLTSLDEMSWEDGEFLVAEAQRRWKAQASVDFSPNPDDRESPTSPSNV